jgi:hypothetical protein
MNLQFINRIRKPLTYTITGALFLIISAFLVLQIPAVQEALIKRYLGSFSKVTGFKTTVGSFQLLWFDRLELRNVDIVDPAQNQMIGAKTIVINFKLSQLFKQSDINIDGIVLEGAHVYLTKIAETDSTKNLNINVFVHRINDAYGGDSTAGRSPRINIGEAVLHESKFSYIDPDKDPLKEGFNYHQFTFDVDESQLQNFLIIGDTTQFRVNTLLAKDQHTKFAIRQLSTFFRISQQSMEFLGLNMEAGRSVISDTIIFTFNGQESLSDFIPKVNIHANLKNTLVQPEDLALFVPQAGKLTKPIYVSGVFDGRIDNFKFTNMEVATGRTILRGALDMEGLPDISETFIILGLKNSRFDFEDFAFLFKDEILKRLTPMGRLNLEGEFLGYPNDFVAKGEFYGNLGRVSSDINFKVNEKNFDLSVYSGQLSLYDFELGTYLKDTTNFQQVNLNGNVKGSGLTLKTADFKLNGRVSSIGIRKYNYKNITTNARFASQLFNGFFKINDPNLQFTAQGSVDLREGFNTIKMQAKLDTAYLRNLNLTGRNIFIHSNIDINIKGLHIDSLAGKADLSDFKLRHNDKWLTLDEIHLNAKRTKTQRSLEIRTNLVDAEVNGNFLMSDITHDVKTLVKELMLNIRNDKSAIDSYYDTKTYKPKSYQTNFKINIKDGKPIANLINVDLAVARNTNIEGKFTSGYTSILNAYTLIDSLSYNKTLLLNTDLEITASKIADSSSVLAMASVTSDQQTITPKFKTKNIVAEAIWNKNHIDFGIDGDQDGPSNYLRLKGSVDFLKDSTQLKIQPSSLKVLEKIWEFDPDNVITVHNRDIKVYALSMRNENQFISANGVISPDPSKIMSLQLNDVDLSLLNPLTGREFSGRLDAIFDLSNFYVTPYVQNDIEIDSLIVDKFLIGNITGKNKWDTLENKFLIDFFVDRQEKRIVNVSGFYNPVHESSPLSVKAKLQNANLRILQPFLEDIFSNIGGTVTGDFNITGKLAEPLIDGEGDITDGEITINYLRTAYRFSGKAGMTPRSIYFKDIEITDMFNSKGKLNGMVSHHNFYSMRINIDASFENFQVLNTSARDNNLFYGQGYVSGDLNIFGPVSNLKITANARTERNTKIFVPIGGTSEGETKEFIKFVNFTDSTFQQSLSDEINKKVDLTGITLDFNLDVTPDAYCEIILDLKSGDIIRGRGNGELQLQFDTKGEFNMFGPFEFVEGGYNFTLYDIINKEFEIKSGSRITWYGDAYGGILDISAFYNQMASFLPIITDNELRENPTPQLKRKYLTQVLLELDGPMLSPQINFDIIAKDLPQTLVSVDPPVRLDFEFQTFKNRIDEQELKRQVFSLIILRRFSPQESFNTSGSIANSVSELLSNQLSNWVSQVDENLEIDVDLSTFDTEAFNTFQLRLSYTFLNGRLRITRDATTFYGNQNTQPGALPAQQNNLATIAGDWTVDYLLTADGKLKVKMYNRTNINPIINIGQQNAITTGVSVLHTQSFNELRDIWRSARNRRKENPDTKNTEGNEEATRSKNDGSE